MLRSDAASADWKSASATWLSPVALVAEPPTTDPTRKAWYPGCAALMATSALGASVIALGEAAVAQAPSKPRPAHTANVRDALATWRIQVRASWAWRRPAARRPARRRSAPASRSPD